MDMENLEDARMQWTKKFSTSKSLDAQQWKALIQKSAGKHVNAAMQYFWASFCLQIIAYALLFHVLIKYGMNPIAMWLSMAGILLYLPFTIVLITRFRSIAGAKLSGVHTESAKQYVGHQLAELEAFFRFKKRYELFLIPLISALAVLLIFILYVPGALASHTWGMALIYLATLGSCGHAIRMENKKNFAQPIEQLRQLLKEFKE